MSECYRSSAVMSSRRQHQVGLATLLCRQFLYRHPRSMLVLSYCAIYSLLITCSRSDNEEPLPAKRIRKPSTKAQDNAAANVKGLAACNLPYLLVSTSFIAANERHHHRQRLLLRRRVNLLRSKMPRYLIVQSLRKKLWSSGLRPGPNRCLSSLRQSILLLYPPT